MKQYKKAQTEEQATKKMLEDVSNFELFYFDSFIHFKSPEFISSAIIHNTKVNLSVQEYFLEFNQPPQ
jgi:hypothetical protein